MINFRSSPDRGSFQIESQVEQVKNGQKTPEAAEEMIELYRTWNQQEIETEQSEEYKIDNLEYDLRSSDYIYEKCKDHYYAQNLYAALCNNEFVKNDVWPLLQDKRWSCSWRHAGGIIAHIREEGDYIDWYCSGITNEHSDEEFQELTVEQQEHYKIFMEKTMPESVVTDEIRSDLLKLGWIVVDED
jgi:hypothetical protein